MKFVWVAVAALFIPYCVLCAWFDWQKGYQWTVLYWSGLTAWNMRTLWKARWVWSKRSG